MRRSTYTVVLLLMLTTGCGNLSIDRTIVENTGPDELLKLRSGPGLGYGVVLGLPDGTFLNRHNCVTEVGQRWCRVSLNAAPQIIGYVSSDYLSAP
ncbi:MAG: SH3 domain-containing protein [Octadecabacter sp.]|nr:SH3 domain-containing protein [Octadecabacter sp.]